MENFLWFNLSELPYIIIALIIAFTLHEFAHAYVAYKFGDPTAKNQGRLTLNPLSHLDPIGTILIIIAGFGWARPVPVNRFFFKKPRLAGVLVSVAGPIANFLIALIALILYNLFFSSGMVDNLSESVLIELDRFFTILINLNVILLIFNLLPFPPLDGYRIIEDLAPSHIRAKLTQFESYGIIIFLVLVITPLGDYTITPLFHYGSIIVNNIFYFILQPFF